MSSAMDELKHKLEQKIDELRAAQDVGDDQSRNPGTNLKLASITDCDSGIRNLVNYSVITDPSLLFLFF